MRTMRSKFEATPAASTIAAGPRGPDQSGAGAREGLFIAFDDGVRERHKFGALRHPALDVAVGQRCDLGAIAAELAARPEQTGMGSRSIETVVSRRMPAALALEHTRR